MDTGTVDRKLSAPLTSVEFLKLTEIKSTVVDCSSSFPENLEINECLKLSEIKWTYACFMRQEYENRQKIFPRAGSLYTPEWTMTAVPLIYPWWLTSLSYVSRTNTNFYRSASLDRARIEIFMSENPNKDSLDLRIRQLHVVLNTSRARISCHRNSYFSNSASTNKYNVLEIISILHWLSSRPYKYSVS